LISFALSLLQIGLGRSQNDLGIWKSMSQYL
jgi:hypothetical protein